MHEKIYFTPGPSKLYQTVPLYINQAIEKGIPSLSHRSDSYMEIQSSTIEALRRLLEIPLDYHIFFGGSATEMMERIIQNTAKEHTLHLVNGAFSQRFYRTAKSLLKSASKVQVEDGDGFSQFPHSDVKPETELICLTQCETSTGAITSAELIETIHDEYPEKLIAVDMVSSCPMQSLDISTVDCAFFSVQKGFGLPSGLGVVIVSDRAFNRSMDMIKYTGGFHSFRSWAEYELKRQTPETPNVLGIFILGKVCQDFLATGLEKIRNEISIKFERIEKVVLEHSMLTFSIDNSKFRSQSVIVLNTQTDAPKISSFLENNNVIIGMGYGKMKSSQLRIANFPAHTRQDVEMLCDLLIRFNRKFTK
ncbi:MAG: aminotransferase class V-fold PLP-dependent enzyme [Fidelibacterota bacterium]